MLDFVTWFDRRAILEAVDHGTPEPWSEEQIEALALLAHDLDEGIHSGTAYQIDTRTDDLYEGQTSERGGRPVLNLGDRPGWLTEDDDLAGGFVLE